METSHVVEKDAFYEQLNAVQRRLPKNDIVIVMRNLNTEVDSINPLLGHVMGKHNLGNRKDNDEKLVDFCNFHRFVIGGTLFKHRACHKVERDRMVAYVRRRVAPVISHRVGELHPFKFNIDLLYDPIVA